MPDKCVGCGISIPPVAEDADPSADLIQIAGEDWLIEKGWQFIQGPDRADGSHRRVWCWLKPEQTLIDPFAAFADKGSELFQEWLQKFSIKELQSIVRQHRLDPSRKSDRWTNKGNLINLITKRIADRNQQGKAFRNYGTEQQEFTKPSY